MKTSIVHYLLERLCCAGVIFIFAFTASGQPSLNKALDHDGDNKSDFLIYRNSDKLWYAQRSDGTYTYTPFGIVFSDYQVPGDYDGDGKGDVAHWRDTDGNFYYLESSTGHLLFRPFGEFLTIAGGSLFQVIMPAIFVGYFVWNEKYYSAAIVLFWVGQSVLNVFIYATDAVVMQLVLLGGLTGSEGGFHDWNYLLTETGLINSTKTVAGLIRLLGTLCIITASVFAIKLSFQHEENL